MAGLPASGERVARMKRILALDGGGIKGVFSLQVLESIESAFREEQGRADLVLADVFDLVAGTSTGAIIAACLSWGMPVAEIEHLYLDCAREIFTRAHWYSRWKAKYRAEPITRRFQGMFSEDPAGSDPALLGTSRLRTLLLIVMRNATTGSPWPVSNIPGARFNHPDLRDCNLRIPLWQLLRGSTAAPSYFPPERIAMGDESFLFMDGGMTPFNNPALIATLVATLPAYGLAWPTGRTALHVISVGTCNTRARLARTAPGQVNLMDAVLYVAPALLSVMTDQQDYLCRVMGDCLHGAPIDAEVGALDAPTLFPALEQKFTYVRYDRPFDAKEGDLDDIKLIPALQRMGRDYAAHHVERRHLHPRA